MKINLKVISKIKNSFAHSFYNGSLYLSKRNYLYRIENLENPSLKIVQDFSKKTFLFSADFRLVDRLTKNGINFHMPFEAKSHFICNKDGWLFLDDHGNLHKVESLPKFRPLSRGFCRSKRGITYIGEYSQNKKRKSVKIYRSFNNLRYDIVKIFKPGLIRHIHSLIADVEEKNRIWILTGDRDHESKILFTDDDFRSIQTFLSAGQLSRATDLIVENGEIIWGTDSPVSKNYLIKAEKKKPNNYQKIEELPGPVYYFSKNDVGGIYFGTTAEPGPYTEGKIARIFSFNKKKGIKNIAKFRKDFIPQHGIVHFPSGILPENYLIFTLRALKPYEGYTFICRDENIW